MKHAANINFDQYANLLGTDVSGFQNAFQHALNIAGMMRSHASLSFYKTCFALCDRLGFRLVVGSNRYRGNFTTLDALDIPVIVVEGLDPSLDKKVRFYHELSHALLHAKNFRDMRRWPKQEVFEEATAEIFAIVVLIHDPDVTPSSMLDYLEEWSTHELGSSQEAFNIALMFFRENWVNIAPDSIVEG